MPLSLSFDIGHSSIGWAVLQDKQESAPNHPDIIATGVVTFPADDCLASQRRDRRRTRRHIRSTRQRIERLKRWLAHRKVLTTEELNRPGHPAPFLLAAAALNGVRKLSALELWHVLRWYAHNRGYDGNSRWSRQDADSSEDAEKVKAAKEQLNKFGTTTMAETVCKLLDINPLQPDRRISSHLPYKTLNTAYPRSIISAEVERILDLHQGVIEGLDNVTRSVISAERELSKDETQLLRAANVKLPKRYHGGLLFGQLVPRFDNRIISRCPITWASIYQANTEEKGDREARRLAECDSKVPAKKSIEFLEYRLARILANLKTDGAPISSECRKTIFERAQDQGRLTHKQIESIIASHHPHGTTNVHAYFQLHPDAEDALVLHPAVHELQKAKGSRAKLSPFWKHLPESAEAEAVAIWRAGKPVTIEWIREKTKGSDNEAALAATIESAFKKSTKEFADVDDFCQRTTASADWPSGRAPFARPVLKQVKAEVLAGHDPTKASKETDPQNGESKPSDGILYEYSVPGSPTNKLLQKRPLEKLTNNPLVRHRLLILERLVEDIVAEFCHGDEQAIKAITVEVARELKEFSGKTAKEIASELSGRHRDFKSAVDHLAKHAPDLPVTGGLIRKCRIAQDLNWICPFTGQTYDPLDLPRMELEHIIPFSKRKTNALHALVLTFPEVNRWKGNRTARQFILDEAGKPVPQRGGLSILTEKRFLDLVGKLNTKGHPDDQKRKRVRKDLLLVTTFDEKDQGFTPGALTQSSHLIKLAMRSLRARLPHAQLYSIPGIATGEIRKSWNLLGALGHPDVCGRDAMRWSEVRDRETGALVTEGYENLVALKRAPSIEKKRNGQIKKIPHPESFPCPNDECEVPLMWPEDDKTSKAHCPGCQCILRSSPKPKDEIRALTHHHHALDALTIGLIAHYFPLTKFGQNQSGLIWQALITRNPNEEQQQLLRMTGMFNQYTEIDKNTGKSRQRFRLKRLDHVVKKQVTSRLAENRVIQHIPSNRSGTKAELTTWGVAAASQGEMTLHQNTSTVENGRRKRSRKVRQERAAKLLGPNPSGHTGKLKEVQGALIIGENFGLALDPTPEVIPFHQVQTQIDQISTKNQGKPPRILRNGMLIRTHPEGTIWKVRSIKETKRDGILLDLTAAHMVPARATAKPWSKRDASIKSLNKAGFDILSPSLTGYIS